MKKDQVVTLNYKAGFRYGDNAPMAIIEFVDRDVEAKRIDKEKKTQLKKKIKKLKKQLLLKIAANNHD